MKVVVLTAVSLFASATWSATVNVRVETDKAVYRVGDSVFWTIYAWASLGDNRGVALLSVDLDDSAEKSLQPPLVSQHEYELQNTHYGTDELFVLLGPGTPSELPPHLRDISVMQMPFSRNLDVCNDGDPNHVLAKGSYTATILGPHTLKCTFNAANYWPDEVSNAADFENKYTTWGSFEVLLNSDVTEDYYVDLGDFAKLSSNWLRSGCDETSACYAADLTRDGAVDFADLAIMASEWLWCTDPWNTDCDEFLQ